MYSIWHGELIAAWFVCAFIIPLYCPLVVAILANRSAPGTEEQGE
jgi:hypothetical protein